MSSHNALLKHVSIAAKDTSLVAKFDIDGNIPGQGAYVVGLVAATPDYSHQRQNGNRVHERRGRVLLLLQP